MITYKSFSIFFFITLLGFIGNNPNNAMAEKKGDYLNISDQIYISEIFPNPKGTDKGKEWIEICNRKQKSISLENWTIKANKEFKLSKKTIIAARSCYIFQNKYLSLNNNQGDIELFNPEEKQMDKVSYTKAPENKSYSKIKIIFNHNNTKNEHFWTFPSKSSPNPVYFEIYGTIITPIQINKEFYFEIEDKEKIKYKIIISEPTELKLLKSILLPGTKIALLAEKDINNNYFIKEYQSNSKNSKIETEEDKTKTNWNKLLLIPLSILLASFLLLIFYRKNLD